MLTGSQLSIRHPSAEVKPNSSNVARVSVVSDKNINNTTVVDVDGSAEARQADISDLVTVVESGESKTSKLRPNVVATSSCVSECIPAASSSCQQKGCVVGRDDTSADQQLVDIAHISTKSTASQSCGSIIEPSLIIYQDIGSPCTRG